jgi:GcrA cell cycle regulator
MRFAWTDERVELMRKLFAAGKSSSEVAAAIGGGVTTNAVIGKAYRTGARMVDQVKPLQAPPPPLTERWTEENVEKLRRLWATSLTSNEIAALIGPWCSRSAVCGKAGTLRLPQRGYRAPSVITPRPKFKPINVSAPVIPQTTERREKFVTRAVLRPIRVEDFVEIPPTERVALVDLEHHHCRWPIGDPTSEHFGFCGAQRAEPTNPFNAYCARHGLIAYEPRSNRKKLNAEHEGEMKAARAKAHARKAY